MLYNSRSQLAMDLCYLAKEDYTLVNDVIHDYCNLISQQRLNDLEDYVNNEVRSIVWGLCYYYSMLSGVDKPA